MKIKEKCPLCDHKFDEIQTPDGKIKMQLEHPKNAEDFLGKVNNFKFNVDIECPTGHYYGSYFKEPEMSCIGLREEIVTFYEE